MASLRSTGGDSRIEIDAHAVRRALARVAPELEKELRAVIKAETIKARNAVKANAPERTGTLKKSISSRTSFTAKKTQGMVTVKEPARNYAWIVEHGRKRQYPFPGRGYIAEVRPHVLSDFRNAVADAVGHVIDVGGFDKVK